MKYYLILSFILFFNSCRSFAINRYAKGDTLFAWAEGGLTIRGAGSISGKRIGVLHYGEKIVVQESKVFRDEEDTIEIVPRSVRKGQDYLPLEIAGSWVKIIYGKTEGYVFDGYLSAFPAPPVTAMNGYEDLNDYLELTFGLLSAKNTSGDEFVIREKYYGQGVSFQNIGTKTAYIRYVFPNFSLEEILLFIKNSRMANDGAHPMLIEDKTANGMRSLKFIYTANGEGYLFIRAVSGLIILETESWC